MSGIQILLIGGIVCILLYFVFELRSAIFDLVLVFLLSGLAFFFILMPQYTNIIAHKIGVGRGADLLFYCCILFFLFALMKLFARIKRLEKQLTSLVQQQAKQNAVFMKNEKSS